MEMGAICTIMKTTCRLSLHLKEFAVKLVAPITPKKYTANPPVAMNHVNLFLA